MIILTKYAACNNAFKAIGIWLQPFKGGGEKRRESNRSGVKETFYTKIRVSTE